MLTITESAWDRLTQILKTRPDVSAIRLKFRDGEFKCCAGDRRKPDRVIQDKGRPTLLMSPGVASDLDSRTLDVTQTKGGPRLKLQPLRSH